MLYDPFRFYDAPPPAPTYFGGTLPTVNVRDSYPNDYVANRVRQGGGRFFSTLGSFLGQPQRDVVELVTGVEQTPSEAMGIENPYGAFAVDAILDPLNVGPTFLARNMLRNPFRVFNSYGRNQVPLNSIGVASDVPAAYGKANYSPEELREAIEMANRDVKAFGESPYNIEKVRAIREEELRKHLNSSNYKSFIDNYRNSGAMPVKDLLSFLRSENKLYVPMNRYPFNGPLIVDDAKKFADRFYSKKMTSPRIQVMSTSNPYALANKNVAGVYFPGEKRLNLFPKNERIYDPQNRLGGDDAYIVNNKLSKSLQDTYLTAIHEGTHGRAFRLGVTDTERKILYDAWKDIIGDDGIKLSKSNPMGKQVTEGKPRIQQFETEALQGELRMLLNDKDGSRIYSEKDIPEIKKAIKRIANTRIAYLSDIRKSPEILEKIDLKPLIKSLNKIGFATTAPYVASKLPNNNKE